MGNPVSRLWGAFNPPPVEKQKDVVRFGIFGAAGIAPLALIYPAKSHSEVIVQCVAARGRQHAEEFAKSHSIPEVKNSYQEIIDDPTIDAVLIPLPNALHFEWAARAIRAGKHVLLEKPSVSNSKEAEILFNLPELSQPGGPILLEAFHNRFHPAWTHFMSYVSSPDVVHVDTASMIPWWGTSKNDIHFNYGLSGGCIMAMGTYNFAALRLVFGSLPDECVSAETHAYTDGVHEKCDWDFEAKFRFPGGGVGEARSTLKGPTIWKPSHVKVLHRGIVVQDPNLVESQEKVRIREVTLHGLLHAIAWHRIDVVDTFEIREKGGKVVKRWTEKKSEKSYSFQNEGLSSKGQKGEDTWMSYRYQLEEFVNRVKGRETRYWIEREDSVENMKMVDMAYLKSGLGLRPTSGFRLE